MAAHIDDLIGKIRGRHPAPWPVRFHVAGVTLNIVAGTEKIAEEIAAYYRPFEDEPGASAVRESALTISVIEAEPERIRGTGRIRRGRAGAGRVKEIVHEVPGGRIIEKVASGLTVFVGNREWIVLGRAAEQINPVVNVINAAYMIAWRRQGLSILHAAAVSWPRPKDPPSAVAIMGAPGAGKSTAALWCMEEGAEYVSNDRLLVGPLPESKVLGVPKHPRVNPGTRLTHPRLFTNLTPEERDALGRLPLKELVELEEKQDVVIENCYGPGRLKIPTRLAGWVFLDWRVGTGAWTASVIPFAALRPWAGDIVRGVDPYDSSEVEAGPDDLFNEMTSRLSRVPGLRISGKADFPALARALRAWILDGILPATGVINPAEELPRALG